MKSSYLRFAAALALILGLGACGGKATYPVAGTITGLTALAPPPGTPVSSANSPDLHLSTNGNTLVVVAQPNATAITTQNFAFAQTLDYGTAFNVVVSQQPFQQTCTVLNPADSAGHTAAISISVDCITTAYPLGGSVIGLTGTGLLLADGSAGGTTSPVPIAAATGVPTIQPVQYSLPAVPYGTTYGITVVTQPTNQTCHVDNGVGTMVNTASATSGTATAGSAGSITLAAGASATDGAYAGMTIDIIGGTGSGQTSIIASYTGSTKVALLTAPFATVTDTTSVYTILSGVVTANVTCTTP